MSRRDPPLRVVPGGADAPERSAEVDAWMERGREIVAQRDSTGWDLVEWISSGRGIQPEASVRQGAEELGIGRTKFHDYSALSKASGVSARADTLSISHHAAVVRLPAEVRDALLATAEAEGWTVARIREAAREASLEGQLEASQREVSELRRELAAARRDPRDLVEQSKSRIKAERRIAQEAISRIAAIVEEAAGDGIAGLHGNAKRGLARAIRAEAEKLIAGTADPLARIDAAASRIEGGS